MKAWTSVFRQSMAKDCRTLRSWRSELKHFAVILETCLSRLKSDENVTPRTQTWSTVVQKHATYYNFANNYR